MGHFPLLSEVWMCLPEMKTKTGYGHAVAITDGSDWNFEIGVRTHPRAMYKLSSKEICVLIGLGVPPIPPCSFVFSF